MRIINHGDGHIDLEEIQPVKDAAGMIIEWVYATVSCNLHNPHKENETVERQNDFVNTGWTPPVTEMIVRQKLLTSLEICMEFPWSEEREDFRSALLYAIEAGERLARMTERKLTAADGIPQEEE